MTSILVLLFTQIPLPSFENHEFFYKQEGVNENAMFLGDYWDRGHDFDVLNYDIEMTVDIPNDSIWANVTITIEALSDTLDTIGLNFDTTFTIESIEDMALQSMQNRVRKLNWVRTKDKLLLISLGKKVHTSETLFIKIAYHGRPYYTRQTGGLSIDTTTEARSVTFTHTEPKGARNWIPCYDWPSDKATFTQRIIVPAGNIVVGNGTLESELKSGNWWTYVWKEHYPQPTYLIAFAASKNFIIKDDFAILGNQKVPVKLWLLKVDEGEESSFAKTPAMVEFFSKIFPPYPFADEKYAQVDLGGKLRGAMEHTTCTFTACYRGDFDFLIAHELAHHWWGDWITCATWADIWLNEGFATYCEALWFEHDRGDSIYDIHMKEIMLRYFYMKDLFQHPLYDTVFGGRFDAISYDKGGSVLHMLRQLLGRQKFLNALSAYALEYANSIATTQEFQEAVEKSAGQDLDWFFDEWVYAQGHPFYEIGWRVKPPAYQSSGAYQVDFAISQMQNQSLHYFPFRMPLEIAIFSNNDTNIIQLTDSIGYQCFSVEVVAKPDSFILDPYNKLLCKIKYHDDIDGVPRPGVEETPADIAKEAISLSVDETVINILHLRFSNPTSQQVTLAVYDASGRLVREFYSGKSATYNRLWPVGNWASGVYFVRLESSTGVLSSKVVKLQ